MTTNDGEAHKTDQTGPAVERTHDNAPLHLLAEELVGRQGDTRNRTRAPQVREEGNSTTIPVVEELLVNRAAARAERQRFTSRAFEQRMSPGEGSITRSAAALEADRA
jgi:hypothetical protein